MSPVTVAGTRWLFGKDRRLYGYGDYTGNAWRYIGMYAKDPIRAISKAMCTVESVLNFLFGQEETHDTDDLSLATA